MGPEVASEKWKSSVFLEKVGGEEAGEEVKVQGAEVTGPCECACAFLLRWRTGLPSLCFHFTAVFLAALLRRDIRRAAWKQGTHGGFAEPG